MNSLVHKNITVVYYTLDLYPDLCEAGVLLRRIPFPTQRRQGIFFWMLFLFWVPVYLLFSASKERPDKLVAFNSFYALVFFPTRYVLRVKTVLFLRSVVVKIDQIKGRNPLLRKVIVFFEKLGILSSDTVVFMTTAMKKEIENSFKLNFEDKLSQKQLQQKEYRGKKSLCKHIALLPNDIQHLNFLPLAPIIQHTEKFTLFTSGVLDKRKNVILILQALRFLHLKGIAHIELVIAGVGEEKESLEAYCKEHGISTLVRFLGWVETMGDIYGDVSLVLHPSLHEGVSNSLLEALSNGLPVIVSDIPEHRELLHDEVFFFNVYCEERVQLLAEKIFSLSKKEGDFTKMLHQSREKAQKLCFDWEQRAFEILQI
jgi:glycosyltransferase involved in cell wall biosynthesis